MFHRDRFRVGELLGLAQETAALALHHDRPNAQPPQAWLLGVPSDLDASWTLPGIEALLREALDLFRIRMVAPEALPLAWQMLPATMFAR